MTPEDRDKRWREIDAELAEISDGMMTADDTAAREQELLGELDRLEFEAGEDYFRDRKVKGQE